MCIQEKLTGFKKACLSQFAHLSETGGAPSTGLTHALQEQPGLQHLLPPWQVPGKVTQHIPDEPRPDEEWAGFRA